MFRLFGPKARGISSPRPGTEPASSAREVEGLTTGPPGKSPNVTLSINSVGGGEGNGTHSSALAWRIPWMEEPGGLPSMGSQSQTQWSDFTSTSHFHALEKELAAHSSVLAWRLPGTGEPGGPPSMGSQSRTRLRRLSSSSSSVRIVHVPMVNHVRDLQPLGRDLLTGVGDCSEQCFLCDGGL